MKWLIDTNIISEWMRREPSTSVLEWGRKQSGFFISVITIEEVYCGLSHRQLPKKRAWFEAFLEARCKVVGISLPVAQKSGEWRGSFLARGIARSQADLLIAGTAWELGVTLVTRNSADFEGCGIPLLNPF